MPSFPAAAARFLIDAGLPGSCRPFLAFDAVRQGPQRLIEHYGVRSFRAADLERLTPFYLLGTDGAGNPLCLDTARSGEIVMLDHEDRFCTQQFVASSIATLAQALLVLYTMRHQDFVAEVQKFDPPAAAPYAFLPTEVSALGE